VYRARKIQRFLSQPVHVAEVFSGIPGVYVPVAETVRGFKEILDGKHDDKPESAFYMKGASTYRAVLMRSWLSSGMPSKCVLNAAMRIRSAVSLADIAMMYPPVAFYFIY
jgi:hypothetical protein